jgi:hypothetical protein
LLDGFGLIMSGGVKLELVMYWGDLETCGYDTTVGNAMRDNGEVEVEEGSSSSFECVLSFTTKGLLGASTGPWGIGGDRCGPKDSGPGIETIDGEVAWNWTVERTGDVVRAGDAVEEGVNGRGANGEIIDEETAVVGIELRGGDSGVEFARRDGDTSRELYGPILVASGGEAGCRIVRARRVASAASFSVDVGATKASCFFGVSIFVGDAGKVGVSG